MESQGNTKDKEVRISRKTGKPVTSWGGYRPGGGRPRRMDEQQIIEKLQPMAETAFRILHEKVAQGDMKAIQLYMQYFIGLPTQKIESKIEGQLNQVQIEVVKPNFEKAPELVEAN
jgi:hypothetical protein